MSALSASFAERRRWTLPGASLVSIGRGVLCGYWCTDEGGLLSCSESDTWLNSPTGVLVSVKEAFQQRTKADYRGRARSSSGVHHGHQYRQVVMPPATSTVAREDGWSGESDKDGAARFLVELAYSRGVQWLATLSHCHSRKRAGALSVSGVSLSGRILCARQLGPRDIWTPRAAFLSAVGKGGVEAAGACW